MTNTVNLSIPKELIDRIDQLAGFRNRSTWIRGALERAVEQKTIFDSEDFPLAADAEEKPTTKPKAEKKTPVGRNTNVKVYYTSHGIVYECKTCGFQSYNPDVTHPCPGTEGDSQ